MIQDIFVYNNQINRVELNTPEILLVKEFAALLKPDEQERHQEALRDAEMTDEEFNDPEFRAACRKFKAIQESNKSIRLLHSANSMVDKFIDYFENADPMERDEQTGKPIYKVKYIQAEMKNLIDVHSTMVELENQVKKQITEKSSIRGGATEGYTPNF